MAMEPETFGRYRIIRKLKGGGMARVYLAEDPQMKRTVFLKIIDPAIDEDSREVIDAERRGAALQDQLARREPGGRIAQIYEIADLDGYFYIAMEFVEGEDLSEVIRRGPIPPDRSVQIALDVLIVLERAHAFQAYVTDREYKGIIHGDIKPGNIRITPGGQVKVLDFGIAKAIAATRGKTQNYFASARYSSPQRLETGEVDAQADLWSVATVLFEMLTSKPYFDAVDVPKLEAAIRKYDSLKQSTMLLPSGLREVVRKALDPDPRKRFQKSSEFKTALERRSVAQAPSADPDATRRTVAPEPDTDPTRRTATSQPPSGQRLPWLSKVLPLSLESVFVKVGVVTALLFVVLMWIGYEIRMWHRADALRSRIESSQISADEADKERLTLEKSAWLPAPLFPAKNALRDRYLADAEHVISNYRSFSPGAAVSKNDWLHARNALNKAVRLAPDNKSIRGDLQIVEGHLKIRAQDYKGALQDFGDAKTLLDHSPDPHLGLALVHLMNGELDRAEEEYQAASKLGARPGRLQQQNLAAAYKSRGDRSMALAKQLRELDKMQQAYRNADADLERAQSIYESIRPTGIAQADRIASERREIQARLEDARRAGTPVNQD